MTLAAQITATGISSPSYSDILTALQNSIQSIYGADIVLTNDSQDGQALAVFAQAIYDNNQLAIAVYNSYSPATAQGVGLSSIVKINGIRRLVFGYSQADVVVTGVANTPITNGIIGDNAGLGTQWNLPALVTIPGGGTITVTATCTTPGAINAADATLTVILTPTAGWQSVSNPDPATPGAPVESDAALRRRQTNSTAIPALTVLDAMLGAIGNIANVGRVWIYDNDTGSTDGNGIPAHSIAVIVQGGDIQTIGDTIAQYKTPGTGTYGTTSVDTVDAYGLPNTIDFFVLSIVQMYSLVTITPLTGYVSTTAGMIQAAIAGWFNGLDIGEDSYLGRLTPPANLSGDAATTATGLTQAQLDVLSATYDLNILALYQARADMIVQDGPFNAGTNIIHVTNCNNYADGQNIAVTLSDGTIFYTSITNVAAPAVTMAANIPGGKSVHNGALIYVAGDVTIAFNEASGAVAANCKIVT